MAEINTKINLIDNMSPALKGMHKALNVLLNTFEAVAAKTKTPIDVKAVQTARNELARVGVMLDKVGSSATNVTKVTTATAAAATKAANANEKFIAKVMNSAHTVNQKLITDSQKAADSKIKSINKTIAGVRTATNQAVAANERERKSVERLANSRERSITRTVAGIYTATNAFNNKTLNMRIASQKATERYLNDIRRRQAADDKAVQQELSNRLKASLNHIALSYKVQGIVDKINSDELAKNTKRVHTEIANEGKKLQAVLNSSMQQMNLARTTSDFIESVNNKAWQNAIKRGQAEHAQMMQAHQSKCASILKEFELSKKTQAWLDSVNNKAWADTIKRSKAEEDAIRKREAAAIAAVKREDAAKWASFDKTQREMGKMIVKSEQLANKTRQIKPAIDSNTLAQNRHNASIKQGISNTSMLWSKIKTMAGAYIGVQTVGGVIKTADALAANEARLNLMVKEGETVKGLSDKIYAAAMRSRTGYLAMADSVAKLGIQAGHLFGNNDQMVRFMETFNKVAVISKSTTQQTNAAMTQLIQALSFGQLRGDELKSILENMPFVAHLIADELERVGYAASDLPKKLRHIAEDGKVTEDEIRAIGYEGELASETVVNAMLNGAKKVDKMAKNMTWTWAQVWEVFKNAALRAFTPIFEGISKIIQTDRFKRFATWVDGAMSRVANAMVGLWNTAGPIIAKIFDGIAAIGNFIGRNWSFIAPIVWGIVGAFTAYAAAVKIAAIWEAIRTGTAFIAGIATAIFTKATMAQRIATMKATAEQWNFNAAVYACPVTWIILALIALILIIYLVVAAINKMTGASISATGIICGAVLWLVAVIWDIVAWLINVIIGAIFALAVIIANIVIGIMNIISGVVQAIVNAWTWCCDNVGIIFDNIGIWWTNLWADCYIFFCDFITKVINKLSSLAEYVQPVAELLGMDIAGKLNKIKKGVSDARDGFASQKKEYKSLKAFKDVNWTSVDYLSVGDAWNTGYNSLGYLDAGKAWDKGYNWGDDVSKKFEAFTKGDSLEDIMKGTDLGKKVEGGDFSKALDGGFDDPDTANGGAGKVGDNPALKKIANNTDKIADNTEKDDDEYFKYLRRAGERRSMHRQQLVNFKVDMSNVNHVKSEVDYDKMMQHFAKKLYDEFRTKIKGCVQY